MRTSIVNFQWETPLSSFKMYCSFNNITRNLVLWSICSFFVEFLYWSVDYFDVHIIIIQKFNFRFSELHVVQWSYKDDYTSSLLPLWLNSGNSCCRALSCDIHSMLVSKCCWSHDLSGQLVFNVLLKCWPYFPQECLFIMIMIAESAEYLILWGSKSFFHFIVLINWHPVKTFGIKVGQWTAG